MIDKSSLTKLLNQAKSSEILVLSVNSLQKDSLQICHKSIEKFIKKQDDYVITVIRR
jgi:hypothetical protein